MHLYRQDKVCRVGPFLVVQYNVDIYWMGAGLILNTDFYVGSVVSPRVISTSKTAGYVVVQRQYSETEQLLNRFGEAKRSTAAFGNTPLHASHNRGGQDISLAGN